MSIIKEGDLELEISKELSKKIAPGFGAVITLSGGKLLIYREVKKIDDRIEDEFVLDCFCIGARNLFGSVFVAFRLEDSNNISVEKYKKEKVFARLNMQRKALA
jgi:hypothetical protein